MFFGGFYSNFMFYRSFFVFFSCRHLPGLRGHSVFSSPPQRPMTSDFEGFFYPRFYPLHLFPYLNSWERASIFPFECSVLNKGTTGTIFITSLVWRGPWLGDWTRDLPHSKPALYHSIIEQAVKREYMQNITADFAY